MTGSINATNNFKIQLIMLFGLVLFMGTESYLTASVHEFPYKLEINNHYRKNIVDDAFLSIGIDTSFIYKMMPKLTDNNWKRLTDFAKALSPAYLRLGGTSADEMTFSMNPVHNNKNVITYETIVKFYKLCEEANIRFIFDFNALLRMGDQWDPTNAETFLESTIFFTKSFQLGNEPNSYLHNFNVSITPEQCASDYGRLQKLLYNFNDNKTLLIGPEVTNPRQSSQYGFDSMKFLRRFLPEGINYVDIISWHQYYFNGRTATLENFLDPQEFDSLFGEIERVTSAVRMYSKSVQVWISETGSAYGGGAPNLSDRFASTFQWIDKLGVSALTGIKVVIRHAFVQGNYCLIRDDLTPTPEFWLSAFYKKLVGPVVYGVSVKSDDPNVRFYAHSALPGLSCFEPNNTASPSWIVFGMNLNNYKVNMTVVGKLDLIPCNVYLFTADDLRSKTVRVNGRPLLWNKNEFDVNDFGTLKPINGVLPAYSIVFWTFAAKLN